MVKTVKKYKRRRLKRTLKKYIKPKLISSSLFDKYKRVSPFELKNKLLKYARVKGEGTVLNAGRGNPNFFNDFCRKIFAHLQLTCMKISSKVKFLHDLNVYPTIDQYNYEKVLHKEIKTWPPREQQFFKVYMSYLKKRALDKKLNVNHIFHDVVLSTLGCYYPVPPQIQPHVGLVCEDFLYDLVIGKNANKKYEGSKMNPDDFECFATEGAAAGILYIFNTLKENFLLNPGDSIALITPIFSPYLEMPLLSDYKLKIVELKGNPDNDYSLDDSEINKLKDKKIKALFMVNPANPSAFSLSKENIEKIGKIVNTERKDLIVLSDNVYAPFVKEYNSFMLTCPRNTIEVFSLSKYFGTTGWRLGLTMVAKDNRFNNLIKHLSKNKKRKLYKRYDIATIDPNKLTFMNRLVFDSRQVAEAHVGGLSTPQQVLIGLFLFYALEDTSHIYKNEIYNLLQTRIELLYSNLNTPVHIDNRSTNYYNLLDIPQITENLYGTSARLYLEKHYEYLEFLLYLARYYQVVLLPGAGFGANQWKARASLANLKTNDYKKISVALAKCIKDFVKPVLP